MQNDFQVKEKAYKLIQIVLPSLPSNDAEQIIYEGFNSLRGYQQQQMTRVNRLLRLLRKLVKYSEENQDHQAQMKTAFFSRKQIFQYLVFKACLQHEMKQESSFAKKTNQYAPQIMICRFFKQIIYSVIKRRIPATSVAVMQFFYDYEPQDVRLINSKLCDQMVEWEEVYVRRMRKEIMDDLTERFKKFLNFDTGKRNRLEFECYENQEAKMYLPMIHQLFDLLVPWNTNCLLTQHTDIEAMEESLVFNGSDPETEGKFEAKRKHILICSECFRQYALSKKLENPNSKIRVPKFFNAIVSAQSGWGGGSGGGGNGGRDPFGLDGLPELSAAQESRITNKLEWQSHRRRESLTRILKISIDGEHCHTLDLDQTNNIQFQIDDKADLIQVYAEDESEDILLSTLSLDLAAIGQSSEPWKSSRRLEGGQVISMKITPKVDKGGPLNKMSVSITYRETNPIRVLRFWLRNKKSYIFHPIPEPAVAWVGMLALIIIPVFLFLWRPQNPQLTIAYDAYSPDLIEKNHTPEVPPGIKVPPEQLSPSNRLAGGLNSLDPSSKQYVTEVLEKQDFSPNPEVQALNSSNSMGGNPIPSIIEIVGPNGLYIRSTKPTFKWKPVPGAIHYQVELRRRDERIFSPELGESAWTPSRPLKRGGVYQWYVKAVVKGESTGEPRSIQSKGVGKFTIIEEKVLKSIESFKQSGKGNHLILGILYYRAGLLEEAEAELNIASKQNSKIAMALLNSLKHQRAK